jgi:hypothetical protein
MLELQVENKTNSQERVQDEINLHNLEKGWVITAR